MNDSPRQSNEKPVLTLIALMNYYALGIRTISSLVKSKDYQVNIIFWGSYIGTDPAVMKNKRVVLDLISSLRTDLVGISVNTPFAVLAEDLTNLIRHELKIKTLWGGAHPTILPDECIEKADIICRGEGERACLELLDCIHKGESYDSIDNLWIRNESAITRNQIRPLLQGHELDDLPFPDYGSDSIHYIDENGVNKGDPFVHSIQYEVIASRGCPYRCTYCVNSILRDIYPKGGDIIRVRSPETVIREIESALKIFHHVEAIRFEDEVFPWKAKWLEEFSDLYRERINLPFICTYVPNIVTEERISLLHKTGLSSIGVGIQSPSERVRKEIFRRPETNERLHQAITYFHKYGVEVNFDLIFDNPYENHEDKAKGFEFLSNLPKPFTLSVFSMVFFPETALTKRALADGFVSEDMLRRQEGLYTIIYDWQAPRDPGDTFWDCLNVLTSRSCMPSLIVRSLSRSKWLRKKPGMLMYVVAVSRYAELSIIALRRLRKGRITWSAILKALKTRKLKLLLP